MAAIEKGVCHSQLLEGRGMPCHAGSHREAPGSVNQAGQEALLWFLWEGTGMQAGLGLPSLNNFSGLR